MSISAILAASLQAETVNEDLLTISMEEIEDSMSLACEAEAEMVSMESALEIGEAAYVGLEALADVVAASQAEGGLDAKSAELLAIATSSVMAPFGGMGDNAMPSMEDFEVDGGRAVATGYAMEKITEKLKDLWQGLMNMIKTAYAATAKWMEQNFAAVGRMNKGAEALAKKAGEAKGQPEEKTVEPAKIQYLMSGGKVASNIASDMNIMAGQVKKLAFSQNAVKAAGAAVDALTKAAEGVEKMSAADVEAAVTKVISDYTSAITSAFEMKTGIDDGRLGKVEGDVSGVETAIGDGLAVLKSQGGMSVPVLEFFNPSEPAKNKIAVDALTASEIAKVAEGAKNLTAVILSVKDGARRADKINTNVEKAGKALLKLAKDDLEGEKKKAMKAAMKGLAAIEKNQRVFDRDLVKHASMVAQAAMSYAVQSMKNLKEKKEDK